MPLKINKSYLNQYIVTFSVTILTLSIAAGIGWPSPTIPKLLAEDSPIPITPDQSSWIVSISVLGMITGPIPNSFLINRIGRKPTILLTVIPIIAGWIIIAFANSVNMLFLARILTGISFGMAWSIPIYLGEIASDSIRGSISTLVTVMGKLGILMQYSIGPYVSIKVMAWLSLSTPVLFFVCFIFMPESPYYLVSKRKYVKAHASLKWLRGNSDDVNEELEMIKVSVMKAQENKGTIREIFTSAGSRRAFWICIGLFVAQFLCGSLAIITYSQQIFEEVGSSLGSELSIIMGVVQLVSAAFSSSVVDRLGRRPLLLISTISTTICNAMVASYFLLDHKGFDVSAISWIPVVAIMCFIVGYTIGLSTVPSAIMGEVFATNIKSIASALIVLSTSPIGFGVTKLYQTVSDNFGIHVSFYIFAVFCFFFSLFVYFLVPETKGKSLDLILTEMQSGIFSNTRKSELMSATKNFRKL